MGGKGGLDGLVNFGYDDILWAPSRPLLCTIRHAKKGKPAAADDDDNAGGWMHE